jgi:hypothetical protein
MKYGKLWNEKTLSTLAQEDQDIQNLINVFKMKKLLNREYSP